MRKKELLKILQLSSVCVGLIIGAGFASGQEILNFFMSKGNIGYIGIVLAGLIIFLTAYAVMSICSDNKITNYQDFMSLIFGKTFGKLLSSAVLLFIAVLFCTMLAGSGALFEQSLGFSFTSGTIFLALVCFVCFLFDLQGLVKINTILVPLMTVGFIVFGIYAIFTDAVSAFSLNRPLKLVFDSFAFSAITYSSYNMITAVPILSGLHNLVGSKKNAFYIALFSSVVLTAIALLCAVLLQNNLEAKSVEIPMLYLASNHGKLIEFSYMFLLYCAIFTTALADGFVVIDWIIQKTKLNKTLVKLLVSITAIFVAHLGFSNFVGIVYPVFGFIGIIEIAMIIYKYFTNR